MEVGKRRWLMKGGFRKEVDTGQVNKKEIAKREWNFKQRDEGHRSEKA